MVQQGTQKTEVTIPHLAETLVSATIGKWLKKPGDYIRQYDVICELMTEKVNTEMPCPIEGTLLEILAVEGQEAAVGEAICVILESGSASSHQSASSENNHTLATAAVSGNSTTNPAAAVSANQTAMGTANPIAAATTQSVDQSMRGRLSPAVQQLAGEHGIDLKQVHGSGVGGRITRKDVLNHLEHGNLKIKPVIDNESLTPIRSSGIHLTEEPRIPAIEVEGHSIGRGEYYIDVTPIRKTIASKMGQSVREIPHAWTMIEVDVSNLVLLRNKLKDEFMRTEGINLTYLAFLLKAVVNAIKDYPIMNSVWAVDKIIVKRDINISLSVGTEDSVLTPVIKQADQKNIAGLASEIDGLIKKTRSGKLTLNDMLNGTFTVNNTGSFGSILSYPIINYPQAAIVTFESIVKKPVVIQDMIAVRSMVNLCLSLDHRILDGVICGRFLQRVKENLESYNLETKVY